jgi:hypothetical protein
MRHPRVLVAGVLAQPVVDGVCARLAPALLELTDLGNNFYFIKKMEDRRTVFCGMTRISVETLGSPGRPESLCVLLWVSTCSTP